MKRSIDLGSNFKPMKRANSSLFSIATLLEDESNPVDSIEDCEAPNVKGNTIVSSDGSDLQDLRVELEYDTPPDDAVSSSCSSVESNLSPDSVLCDKIVLTSLTTSNKSEYCGIIEDKSESSTKAASFKLQTDHRTGLIFESAANHFDRYNRFHKERPTRVTSVFDYLSNSKPEGEGNDNCQTILQRCYVLENQSSVAGEDKSASSAELWLDDEDFLRVHLPGYMQRLDKISTCTCHNWLDTEAEQFKSIYLTIDSVREAKTAASSLCRLVSDVVTGSLDNGFAIIRPPGHHAEPGLAGGYCVINNIAVAATYAREKLGVKKVLIVDWDVHHGNGTQRCFFDDPNVLYFSVHRYHGGNFFPFLQQGGPKSVGSGAGRGFNINVGWNDKNMGDDEYLVVFEKLLMPVALEFGPDLVLVSAGFDAANGDMGECDVSPECFGRLTRRLKTLAKGKVVCALEGGYVRSVLCKCIESVIAALLDSKSNETCKEELDAFYDKIGDQEMLECIRPSAARSIRDTMRSLSEFWKCLN